MQYQNIFSKKPVAKTTRLHVETEDFDYTHRLLENESLLEDNFFDIMRDQMMVTHIALKENSVEILQEGFRDFVDSTVEFFKKMLEKFKEFMSRFFMYIHAYMGNFDKFLQKYADELTTLNPDFQLECYDYTFDEGVPNLDKLRNIVSSYNSQLSEIEDLKKTDVIKQRKEFLSSEMLDDIRAQIIGYNKPILSEDYLMIVKQSFRNGAESPESITIDRARLLKAISDYSDLKKLKKQCEQDRDNTIRLVESLKDFFNRSAAVHYKDDKKVMYLHKAQINNAGTKVTTTGNRHDIGYTGSKMETVNLFYSLKFVEAKEIGSMATTATIEKVHALKEAIKMTQTIIRKSLGYSKTPGQALGIEGGTN